MRLLKSLIIMAFVSVSGSAECFAQVPEQFCGRPSSLVMVAGLNSSYYIPAPQMDEKPGTVRLNAVVDKLYVMCAIPINGSVHFGLIMKPAPPALRANKEPLLSELLNEMGTCITITKDTKIERIIHGKRVPAVVDDLIPGRKVDSTYSRRNHVASVVLLVEAPKEAKLIMLDGLCDR